MIFLYVPTVDVISNNIFIAAQAVYVIFYQPVFISFPDWEDLGRRVLSMCIVCERVGNGREDTCGSWKYTRCPDVCSLCLGIGIVFVYVPGVSCSFWLAYILSLFIVCRCLTNRCRLLQALLKKHEALMSDLEAYRSIIDGLHQQAASCKVNSKQ